MNRPDWIMTFGTALAGFALAVSMAGPVSAQERLPDVSDLAHQLAMPDSRNDTLLTLAAILRGEQRLADGETLSVAEGVAQDRAWLERLLSRRGWSGPGSAVLDPAAWMIRQNLARLHLPAGAVLSPTGPGLDRLLHAVFQRSNERLAAAALPELLWRLEAESTVRWSRLREKAANDERLRGDLAPLVSSWQGSEAVDAGAEPAPEASEMVTSIADELAGDGPPDTSRLIQLRRVVLAGLPAQEENARFTQTAFLRLGSLLDGLHEGRYTAFAEGLLSVAGELSDVEETAALPVAHWLEEHLPDISATYARAFAEVDPRLNSALAAAFDIARSMPIKPGDPAPGDEIADAVAQLALLMPDIDYYFGLPVRDTIVGNVDACLGMLAQQGDAERPAMSRDIFDDCLDSLVRLADTETRSASLSGDLQGPFGPVQLEREVSVTPVQRINYALGYLHERYPTNCDAPSAPLPNPLEWASLASLLTWFAEQMPVYFQTPENEARLLRMRSMGNELLDALAAQSECLSGSGATPNDPVVRSLADYRFALNLLSRSLQEAVAAYREQVLAPGADIALESDALQSTLYRPNDLKIVPCNPDKVCEMAGPLNPSRALLGLFPEPYLIADQSGLGEVQLCYENMQWVDRRSEPVRPDDDNVANYYGRFAFDLKGRFLENGAARDVFAFRFTTPDEYHYLFAAASDEVLEDSCPVEWLGSRIVTSLPNDRMGVVPNRLTYLAAARMLPSRLLEQNWESGAEWRDWFTTGLGVSPLAVQTNTDIIPAVTEHLQSLYLREQSSIYRALLGGNGAAGLASVREHLDDLSTQKNLVRMLVVLLYPRSLVASDAIRSGMAGQGGLLDGEILGRFREDDVPVNHIADLGLSRLENLEIAWREQPEATLRSGSIATGVAHAMLRLDQAYRNYFAAPAQPPVPVEVEVTDPEQPATPDG